jgi:hypothetical protein
MDLKTERTYYATRMLEVPAPYVEAHLNDFYAHEGVYTFYRAKAGTTPCIICIDPKGELGHRPLVYMYKSHFAGAWYGGITSWRALHHLAAHSEVTIDEARQFESNISLRQLFSQSALMYGPTLESIQESGGPDWRELFIKGMMDHLTESAPPRNELIQDLYAELAHAPPSCLYMIPMVGNYPFD